MNAEKVILHRFSKTLEKEVYITNHPPARDMFIPVQLDNTVINVNITFDKKDAKVYTRKEATEIRDYLNRERAGHQYLWLMKEV